ncbi:WD40/YVTN/BNR-like repeat-containing protein [Clostridium polynesiense]|uniref:WD40/YVTN/BNR-like repeat-containing protein n=1 Tax=Clostridium polynesiense TaxID=1325933 RepID=UPI00058C565B|nr:sialidase family protein [Clostridium polynesiense]
MESKRKLYKIIKTLSIIAVILVVSYFAYYKYQQSKIKIHPPEGFSVEVNTQDITEAGSKWLENYIQQYQVKYIPKKQEILQYSIEDTQIREKNVIQIDFSLEPKKPDEQNAHNWNGVLVKNKIKSQWVLWFEEKATPEGNFIYTVTKLQRPAAYDLEKYQTSGEKEKDQYRQEYEAEIPYEEKQYTYKIENKVCYVSYDKGNTWKKVPVSLDALVSVGDGRPYYNKLQEKSYIITPEKTAFIYGGTREYPLMITYSEDMGETWNTSEISKDIDSTRVKFTSFPKVKIGYVIVAGGRTMSQEGQIIYKTNDGGSTWKKAGSGPSTWLLKSAGFIDENLGFMSYPKIEGAETNFYRTEDGGKTFQPVILPAHKVESMGTTLEPFIQPETPYEEGGELFLLVGQGDQGDFQGGTVMAKYKSKDKGKTWSFVELVEPPSKEIG